MTRRGFARVLLGAFSVLVVGFLVLPLLIVIPLSFTPGTVFSFPPHSLSLRWYGDYLSDGRWLSATWLSIRLAVTVALVSTSLGLLAAIGVNRYLHYGRSLIRGLLVAPLIVPPIVIGVAVFDIYSRLGLLRTFVGLVIAHTILALPFSFLVLENALRRLDDGIIEAARSLGASTWRVWREVGFPSIAPSLWASLLFGFLISWDEIVLAVFVGGVRLQTLPLLMFQFIETEIRPTLAAVSALIVYVVIVVVVVSFLWRRKRARYTAS